VKRQHLIAAAGAFVLLAGLSRAAERPDFTGTWVIDVKKSDFGEQPVPEDLSFKIKMTGPDLYVTQFGGGQSQIDLHFHTEGKEMTNEVPGATMTSKHRWAAGKLIGELRMTGDSGNVVTFKDQVSLSPDGTVQTLERDMSGPNGAGHIRLVMNKKAE
jgi:hypothetical protein